LQFDPAEYYGRQKRFGGREIDPRPSPTVAERNQRLQRLAKNGELNLVRDRASDFRTRLVLRHQVATLYPTDPALLRAVACAVLSLCANFSSFPMPLRVFWLHRFHFGLALPLCACCELLGQRLFRGFLP
jgi:hypothetical protein